MERLEIYPNKNVYSNELRRVESSPISKENKEWILKYHNHLRAKNASDKRIVKMSWQLRRVAEILNKPFDLATKSDWERMPAALTQYSSRVKGKEGRKSQ